MFKVFAVVHKPTGESYVGVTRSDVGAYVRFLVWSGRFPDPDVEVRVLARFRDQGDALVAKKQARSEIMARHDAAMAGNKPARRWKICYVDGDGRARSFVVRSTDVPIVELED